MSAPISTEWPYDRLPIPMFQTDASGRLQHVNQSWLALLGMKSDDVREQRLSDFIAPSAAGDYWQTLQEAALEFRDLESQFVSASGVCIDVLLSVSLDHNEDGAFAGVLGVMVDLTARRTAEHTAARTQALLTSVITNAKDAILITEAEPIDPPNHPRVLYSNPAFTTMTGYSSEEICGKTPRILQGPRTDRRELDRLRNALKAWEPVRVELVNYAKDGTEINVEIDITPVADETGYFTHWIAIQRDISTRRRNEEERLRTIVERVPQLMWRSSDNGEWTWASKQWLDYTGQTIDEARGWGWLSAVHPDDHGGAVAACGGAHAHGQLDVEFRVCHAANGAYVWHHTRSVPMVTGTRITEWLGTTSDIQALKELQQGQQLLLDELQHRTRNLLAVVQAISDKTLDQSASLEQFGAEYRGRLSALSRVQGLLARTNDDAVDLRQLVEAELAAHGGGKAANIHVEGPPIGLTATAVQAFALALHELATNAIKYGALGQVAAHLSVTWSVEEADNQRIVALKWRESGVDMPDAPGLARKGYGTELICDALQYQLNAVTNLKFGADGVLCSIKFPLKRGERIFELAP